MPPPVLTPPIRSSQGPEPSTLPVARILIERLLADSIILVEDWDNIPEGRQQQLFGGNNRDMTLALLVDEGLLTEYQAARVSSGQMFGLIIGNYRILDRIGTGGMAVVYKAEHRDMRHTVAIKVMQVAADHDPRLRTRFTTEMRIVARLRHPNIVTATDAGHIPGPDPDHPALWYLVMEYVSGMDLEELVLRGGPLPVARACNLAHQVASALVETHKLNLVHRDLKPSNVLVTPEDQAKLLDFGLSRNFNHGGLTQPGTVLGTVDFMAPEQAQDASSVDIRADIYGLGGTLFYALTGRLPFPEEDSNPAAALLRRLSQAPPSLRQFARDVPPELDAVVTRMLATRPEDRYQTPLAVLKALLPFLRPECREYQFHVEPAPAPLPTPPPQSRQQTHRILIVDDEPSIRDFSRRVLESEGIACDEAAFGAVALAACADTAYDLVLLDVNMPGMTGLEVLRHLRANPPTPHLKVVMFSGMATADEMAEMLLAGADDYLTKPFSLIQLCGRIKAALRLKDAQDRSAQLNTTLLAVNAALERNLTARDSDLVHARNALVLALAKLVEHRDNETGAHLMRLQQYCRVLAEQAARAPSFAGQIDQHFIEMLECCAPLHDIGKVGLPDHILLKPGKLLPDERVQMQMHTTIGADTLREVANHHGGALAFLQMAIDITRHHHERWDGNGYPDRLAGNTIPLAARIVALCDVYDALRSRRVYKPALSHAATLQLMTEGPPGQFDPALLQVFVSCADEFDRIFRDLCD